MSMKRVAKKILTTTGLMEPARRVAREIHTFRQNRLTEEEIAQIYEAQYHANAGYGQKSPEAVGDWEPDEVVKREHARAILSVLPLRKVVVGGCSGGQAVVSFREEGVDAWGFEISPDLDSLLLPAARGYVRPGRMDQIPFGREDAFDAIITTDVLEHVQLRQMDRMMSECARLEVPWMVHLINHYALTPDHMTLKPLSWWSKRFARFGYQLRTDMATPRHANPRVYGLNGDPDHLYTFWERRGPPG